MAVAGRSYSKAYSFASQDWDLLSSDCDETSQQITERLSVASLSSDESDAVIIFGGNKISRTGSVKSSSSSNSNSNSEKHSTTQENVNWEITHENLLANISKDPILQGFGSESSKPVEQRLFEQIAQLEEKLENSQDETCRMFMQNEKLSADNELLRRKLEDTIKLYCSKNKQILTNPDLRKGKSASEIKRATILLAAGMGLIVLVKKKLVFSSVGFVGALVFAGSLGVYGYLNDEPEEDNLVKV